MNTKRTPDLVCGSGVGVDKYMRVDVCTHTNGFASGMWRASPAAFGGMSVSELGEARSPQARRPGVDVVLASRLDETEIGDAQTA